MSVDVIKELNEWVAALESGTYKQGYRRLKVNYGGNYHHCCLGVLVDNSPSYEFIDSAIAGIPETPKDKVSYFHKGFPHESILRELYLHTSVGNIGDIEEMREWIESKTLDSPVYISNYASVSFYMLLTVLNDSGATFQDISELLKRFFIPYVEKELNAKKGNQNTQCLD